MKQNKKECMCNVDMLCAYHSMSVEQLLLKEIESIDFSMFDKKTREMAKNMVLRHYFGSKHTELKKWLGDVLRAVAKKCKK